MDPTSKQVIKMVLEAVQHLASSLQSSELELALEMAGNRPIVAALAVPCARVPDSIDKHIRG